MIFRKLFLASALIASLASGAVLAQSFPSKLVTIIVPYPPGGPADTVARSLAHELGKKWLQQVIVDNRPGAAEIVAAQYAAKTTPDGHAIYFATDASLSMNQFAYKKLPYDPVQDFTPVTQLVSANIVLAVSPNFPANTIQEFLAEVRKNPGKYSFGEAGTLNYVIRDFLMTNKLEMTQIPYQGLAPLMPDLLSGRVDAAFGILSTMAPFATSGKIKAIAFTGKERSKIIPEVPTMKEAGLGELDLTHFFSLSVRAGTPADIVEKIANDTREVFSRTAYRENNLIPYGMEPVASTPAEFAQFLEGNRKMQASRFIKSGLPKN